MKVQGKFEWADYLEANRLHVGSARLWVPPLLVLTPLLVLGLMGVLRGITGVGIFLCYLAPVLTLFIVAMPLVANFLWFPYSARVVFYQQKELSAQFEAELTDTHLYFSTKQGRKTFRWANFVRWRENNKTLLAYHSDAVF